jgi:hypothetical protein
VWRSEWITKWVGSFSFFRKRGVSLSYSLKQRTYHQVLPKHGG